MQPLSPRREAMVHVQQWAVLGSVQLGFGTPRHEGKAMKSPRTTAMREWIVRIWLRPYVTKADEIPTRTWLALMNGEWIVTQDGTAILLRKGREWVQAFKDGTKSIGCKP